ILFNMSIFGIYIPLWAFVLIVIAGVIIGWKIIKFALKLLITFIIALLIVAALDYFNIFALLRNFLTGV
ncbi:MAG: hypothetical protein J7K13_06395, partial [Thermoplasmata archaeon]|nr:hypothetical protein [Thermoplasmata archaeon]